MASYSCYEREAFHCLEDRFALGFSFFVSSSCAKLGRLDCGAGNVKKLISLFLGVGLKIFAVELDRRLPI